MFLQQAYIFALAAIFSSILLTNVVSDKNKRNHQNKPDEQDDFDRLLSFITDDIPALVSNVHGLKFVFGVLGGIILLLDSPASKTKQLY